MEEMPNVLDNYEKYHEKGFEVVGISLDDSTENVSAFLETNKIPWVTLIDEDETKRGFDNPLARHYGVNGIPQVILVDQEGKVVSLEARRTRSRLEKRRRPKRNRLPTGSRARNPSRRPRCRPSSRSCQPSSRWAESSEH
jgi:hypothetical protein